MTEMIEKTVSDTIFTFTYNLDPKVDVLNVQAPNGIQFQESDGGNRRYIESFTIHLVGMDELETRARADDVAKALVDKIILRTKQFTEHRFNRSSKITPKGTVMTNTITSKVDAIVVLPPPKLDLTDLSLESLTEQDENSDFEQRLLSLKEGLKVLLDNRYEEAVKQFYMVLEGRLPRDAHKFTSLRDALSHKELKRETIENIQKYNWQIDTPDSKFDRASRKNRDVLRKAAHELKDIAAKYLREDYRVIQKHES